MLLRVEHVLSGDTASITAVGEIDLATVSKIRSALMTVLAADVRHVVLDLDQVTYIDSSGLGTMVGAHKRIIAAGGTLTVRCSQPRVLRLFSITGVDRVLNVQAEANQGEQSKGMPEASSA